MPLLGSGIVAALLVPDTTLVSSGGGSITPGPTGIASPLASPLASALASGVPDVAPAALGVPLDLGGAVVAPDNVRSIIDGRRGIEMLHGVEMEVTVELGRTQMAVRDLLALAPGAVLALDRAAGSPADLLVNGRLIARGEVVVIDEDFGLRVTEILDQSEVG